MSIAGKPRSLSSRVTLEIVGVPGRVITIFSQLRLQNSPPIFEGRLPPNGRIRLRVPRSLLSVVAQDCGHASVQFDEDENFRRVDVRLFTPSSTFR